MEEFSNLIYSLIEIIGFIIGIILNYYIFKAMFDSNEINKPK